MNKNIDKGFTLIELLAVIIILGILMLIAIPSVTEYISKTRKKTYISIAHKYVDGAVNKVNNMDFPFTDKNVTYYIPAECIPLEKGGKSPYGDWIEAYVVVEFTGDKYNYYWTSYDTSNMGIKLKSINDIVADDVMPGVDNITKVGINGAEYVGVLNNCSTPVIALAENDGSTSDETYLLPGETAVGNSKYKDASENVAMVPNGFTVSNKVGENSVANGLVVLDSNGNEYVWIPCTVDGSNGSVKYEKWTTNGVAYNNVNVVDSTLPAGIFNEKTQIEKYGGFYIARYSAGLPGNMGGSALTVASSAQRNKTGYLPVFVKDASPWNYIGYNNAKINAEAMFNSSELKSGLLTGTQYDTVMKWLQNAGYNVNSDSSLWGNYLNVTVTGITSYSITSGASWLGAAEKPSATNAMLKTGNSEYTKANNIYDLAGNIREWTSEKCSATNVCSRGGNCGVNSNQYAAGNRTSQDPNNINSFLTFRIVLYIE